MWLGSDADEVCDFGDAEATLALLAVREDVC